MKKITRQLEASLEEYCHEHDVIFLVDDLTEEYVSITQHHFHSYSPQECRGVAMHVKQQLLDAGLQIPIIFVGAYFWLWDNLTSD